MCAYVRSFIKDAYIWQGNKCTVLQDSNFILHGLALLRTIMAGKHKESCAYKLEIYSIIVAFYAYMYCIVWENITVNGLIIPINDKVALEAIHFLYMYFLHRIFFV